MPKSEFLLNRDTPHLATFGDPHPMGGDTTNNNKTKEMGDGSE